MFSRDKKVFILAIIFTILALGLNAFIIYQSCLGTGESTTWSEPVAEAVRDVINTIKPETITEANYAPFSISIRKLIGHFGLFGLDGIITSLALYFDLKDIKKMSLIFVSLVSLFVGIFVASLTEMIQFFIPGRAGLISDVLIDSGGYLIAVIGMYIIIKIITKRKLTN